MTRKNQIGALGLAVALSVPAYAFQRPQNKSNDQNQKSSGRFQGPGPHAGDWLRKNMNTPPAQQKQELEKSDDFKKLNPAQQQQLLNRLNHFNNMSPDQKNRVLTHMQWLEHLPPDQRQKADALHQQFHSLSPDRRTAVRRGLFSMRDMSPQDRQKTIDSQQMKSNYSDQERQIMKGYTDLGFPDQHAEEEPNSPQL